MKIILRAALVSLSLLVSSVAFAGPDFVALKIARHDQLVREQVAKNVQKTVANVTVNKVSESK